MLKSQNLELYDFQPYFYQPHSYWLHFIRIFIFIKNFSLLVLF